MILLVVLLVLLAHADATAAVQISTFPVLYYEYIGMCIHLKYLYIYVYTKYVNAAEALH